MTDTLRPPAVICDMDGTLVDVRDIRHFVAPGGKRDFPAFHAASIDSPPHAGVVELLDEHRAAGAMIIIVTAREAKWSFLTSRWLRDHDIDYDEMLMRARGDFRPDAEVKAEFAADLAARFDVRLAIDDRDEVIAVWRRFDFPVVKVADDGTLSACDHPS